MKRQWFIDIKMCQKLEIIETLSKTVDKQIYICASLLFLFCLYLHAFC